MFLRSLYIFFLRYLFSFYRFMTHVTRFYDEYINLNAWKQWLFHQLNIPIISVTHDSDDFGESPAVEVMKFKQNNGYFASKYYLIL